MIELSDISFMELTLYGLSVVSAGILGVRWGSKNKGANDLNFHSLLSSVKAPTTVNKPDPALVKAWIIRLHAAVQKNWNHADVPAIRDPYHCTVDHNSSFMGLINQLITRCPNIFTVKEDYFEYAEQIRPSQLKEVEEAFKRYAQTTSFENALEAYQMMAYAKMLALPDSFLDEDDLEYTEIVAIRKIDSTSSRSAVALLYTEDDSTPFRLVSIRHSVFGTIQSLHLTQFNSSYGGTKTTSIPDKMKSNWYRRLLAP